MKNYSSVNDAVTDLKKRGYKVNFESESFCLYCGDLDLRLNPEQFKVDEEYRFKGEPNHEDESIVVAISSSNGIKGILMDGYESYAENKTLQNTALTTNTHL